MWSFYHFPSEVPSDSTRLGCSSWHNPLSEAPTSGLILFISVLMMSTCWSEPCIFEDTFKWGYQREFFTSVTRKQSKQLYLADFNWFVYYLFVALKGKKTQKEAFEHTSVWANKSREVAHHLKHLLKYHNLVMNPEQLLRVTEARWYQLWGRELEAQLGMHHKCTGHGTWGRGRVWNSFGTEQLQRNYEE